MVQKFAETVGVKMSAETTSEPRFSRGAKVLALTSIATFLVSLDSSIVTIAFRDIVGDFGESNRHLLTWIFLDTTSPMQQRSSRLAASLMSLDERNLLFVD